MGTGRGDGSLSGGHFRTLSDSMVGVGSLRRPDRGSEGESMWGVVVGVESPSLGVVEGRTTVALGSAALSSAAVGMCERSAAWVRVISKKTD